MLACGRRLPTMIYFDSLKGPKRKPRALSLEHTWQQQMKKLDVGLCRITAENLCNEPPQPQLTIQSDLRIESRQGRPVFQLRPATSENRGFGRSPPGGSSGRSGSIRRGGRSGNVAQGIFPYRAFDAGFGQDPRIL